MCTQTSLSFEEYRSAKEPEAANPPRYVTGKCRKGTTGGLREALPEEEIGRTEANAKQDDSWNYASLKPFKPSLLP